MNRSELSGPMDIELTRLDFRLSVSLHMYCVVFVVITSSSSSSSNSSSIVVVGVVVLLLLRNLWKHVFQKIIFI